MQPAPRTFLGTHDSSRAYLEACIERYAAWEPSIAAFECVDFDGARAAADASDERRRNGTLLSPIDGMPVAIKDVIETANLPTGNGSPIFAGVRTGRDAASVAALRDAGAVIFGKTVSTEFASSGTVKSRNPWDPARTTGASSAGSAAAVGAGVVPAALGTQALASIVRPAGYCGCFGYKPTAGGINRGGSYDVLSQSVQGVLAASLREAWVVAQAIVRRAGGEPGSGGIAGPEDLPAPQALRRVALLETAGWASASGDAKAQLADLVARLRAGGVAFASRHDDPAIERAEAAVAGAVGLSRRIHTWEFRWPLNTLVREGHADGLSAAMRERVRAAERMHIDEYRAALAERATARESFEVLRERYDAALTLCATGTPPPAAEGTGDPVFAVPSSLLGVPVLALPLMRSENMPLGAQLLGFAGGDAALFAHAAWLVQGTAASSV